MAGRDRLHDRPCPPARRRQKGLEERGLGRSRGGLTTKLHLACDGQGRPLAFLVTAGNRNDCTQAEAVISLIRVAGPGPGRPRTRPDHVVADKGYSARTFRAYRRRRGIKATIPERVDQLAGRKRRRERPLRVRQSRLPTTQRRRTLLPPPQTMARHRHPRRRPDAEESQEPG
ncbi:transposase [Streptomyces sp. NPDC050842]|uniref:transposase n=1 Tax=Streptomyces sp. NPDC050842 TaxID=3365636 RepID=UPI0037964CE6